MKEIRNYIEDSLKGLFSAEEIRSLTKMILERCCSIPQQRLLFDKDIQISDTQKQDIEAIRARRSLTHVLRGQEGGDAHGLPARN